MQRLGLAPKAVARRYDGFLCLRRPPPPRLAVDVDRSWAAGADTGGQDEQEALSGALIEVLLVLSGITAAFTVGSVNVDVVAVEARSLGPDRGCPGRPMSGRPGHRVR